MSMTDGDIFEVGESKPQPKKPIPPNYRIYEGSKIAISKAVGKAWQTRLEAARSTYSLIYDTWKQLFEMYNFHHNKTLHTTRGMFQRGDGSENIIYSDLNVLLPAVASKNPDITCNTIDEEDEPFCKTMAALISTTIQDRYTLNLKAVIKRAVGFALLTNLGVMKLDFQMKDDSREEIVNELERITQELTKVKTQQEVEDLYGQLQALEAQMEVSRPSGPSLSNVLSSDLIVDPYAERPDGLDAEWMIEKVLLKTEYLNARFTQKDEDGRVLVYKPTHKASFAEGAGNRRDDAMGLVMESIQRSADDPKQGSMEEERLNYLYTYYTECYYVWDKGARRLMLFESGDWTYPLWVWDDPLNITRFFPYFLIVFGFGTAGTVAIGDAAYTLDQQDELNDMNRQFAQIRRTVFDHFVYNSTKIKPEDAETLVDALRGVTKSGKHAHGVELLEGKLSDVFMPVVPPSAEIEELFNKQRTLEASNRIKNSNDALRGVQFKANTNEDAVETYQDAVRLSVGAKIDVVEDVVEDLCMALAELYIQNYDTEKVAGLVGRKKAESWQEMTLEQFRSEYSLRIVAGSMEKPNSVFKKKEAAEIGQVLGQFAQAAPGAVLKIMLRVFSNAFTEINVKQEDWEAIDEEIAASLQKGVSTGGQGQGSGQSPGQPPGPNGGQPQPQPGQASPEIELLLQTAPPQVKKRAAQMAQSGASPEEILQTLQAGAANDYRKGRRSR